MFLMDSDHASVLWFGRGKELDNLRLRLSRHDEDDFSISIITVEEQLRGWLAYVAKARDQEGLIKGYQELKSVVLRHAVTPVTEYGMVAAEVFEDLRNQKIRIGTMDLQIAAIAIANDLVLLTRNTVDFNRVPNLQFEDWTKQQG